MRRGDLHSVRMQRHAARRRWQIVNVEWLFFAFVPKYQLTFASSGAPDEESFGMKLQSPKALVGRAVGQMIAHRFARFPIEAECQRFLHVTKRIRGFVQASR